MRNRYFTIAFLFICLVTGACNNSGEGDTSPDSANKRLPVDNTQVKDTASYERMPQKVTDSSGN